MNDKFLSVPLCTLSMDCDYKVLTNLILHYGIVKFSHRDVWRNENIVTMLLRDKESDKKITDEKWAKWAYQRVFRFEGATGNLLVNNYSVVKEHIENFESQYGKDAYFSIGRNLLFDAYKGDFKEREFRVYAAIRSVLGANKKYARITMDRITCRMYGYKNKESFEDSLIKPITNKMIKNSINKLIDKGLIVSFTNKNRFTYYSSRLNLKELMKAVSIEIKNKNSKRLSSEKIKETMYALVNS